MSYAYDFEPRPFSRGWFALRVIDGRSYAEARQNAPFTGQHRWGLVGALVILLLMLLAALSALALRPMMGESGAAGPLPLTLPTMTQVQRQTLADDPTYQFGVIAGRLPPWGADVPETGISRVTDPRARRRLQDAIDRMARLGRTGDYRLGFVSPAAVQAMAVAGRPRLKAARAQAQALREEFRALDSLLERNQTVTPYHRGVLSLWLGDAPGAVQEFNRVLTLVAAARDSTPNLGKSAGMRLDSLQAAALYGRGLAEASGQAPNFETAAATVSSAIVAATSQLGQYPVYRAADDRVLVLDRGDHLIPLDLGDMRADLIAFRLRSGDRKAAEKAAERLFEAGDAPGNPALSANLQLLAAGRGQAAVVEGLAFEGPRYVPLEAAAAQALARAVVDLPSVSDGRLPVSGTTADLIHLQQLRASLVAGLNAGTLEPPVLDSDFNDPTLFARWKADIGGQAAEALLNYGDRQSTRSPARAKAIYEQVVAGAGWLPDWAVFDARMRLATGQSLIAIGVMLLFLAIVMIATTSYLLSRRKGYRELMQSHHYLDRVAAEAAAATTPAPPPPATPVAPA